MAWAFDSDYPSSRSSQPSSRSCLTTPQLPNQYYRATGSGVPLHLPACLPLSAFLLFLPSSSCFPLSRIHLRQGARARLLKSSGWKCDNNTTKTKMPGQERRESGRMKNAKSTFRLVGVQWSPRGPSVVNNRQEVKMQDEGRVCVW